MEYTTLLLLHVFLGIFWAGGAIVIGLFVLPAVFEAGPGGGAVMAGVAKRRLPTLMTYTGVIVVLTGLRLYMLRFSSGWFASPEGVVLTLGGLLGLGALGIGSFVQRPMVQRMSMLAGQVAAGGGPTPEQAAELAALRTRVGKVGRILAWHLIGASLLMASHTLAMQF